MTLENSRILRINFNEDGLNNKWPNSYTFNTIISIYETMQTARRLQIISFLSNLNSYKLSKLFKKAFKFI